MLRMPLQLENSEVCAIEIITALPEDELKELILEVLEELGLDYEVLDWLIKTERGEIRIEDHGKGHFGIRLLRVVFPDETIFMAFRKKLMVKRAGA